MNIKKKKKESRVPYPQELTVADVCLTSVSQQSRRGILGETLVKISHMFSLFPLFPCLFHPVCVDPLMSLSPPLHLPLEQDQPIRT